MWIIVWLHMEVCINACHIKYSQLSAKLLESPSHVKQSKNCDTVSHAVDSVWKVQVCQQLRLNI